MYIYQNGDRCPCCGKLIEGMNYDWLEVFSQLCRVAGFKKLDIFDPEIQDMDTTILKPPDAGIYPPVPIKPKF